MQNTWKMTETLAYGYSYENTQSYSVNTNMTGLDGFQKSLHPCALDESSISIGRVNMILSVQSNSALDYNIPGQG